MARLDHVELQQEHLPDKDFSSQIKGYKKAIAELEDNEKVSVYSCNVDTVRLFLSMSTQWSANMGGLTGLNYTAMQSVAGPKGITVTEAVFDGVQFMETIALRIMRKKAKTNGTKPSSKVPGRRARNSRHR